MKEKCQYVSSVFFQFFCFCMFLKWGKPDECRVSLTCEVVKSLFCGQSANLQWGFPGELQHSCSSCWPTSVTFRVVFFFFFYSALHGYFKRVTIVLSEQSFVHSSQNHRNRWRLAPTITNLDGQLLLKTYRKHKYTSNGMFFKMESKPFSPPCAPLFHRLTAGLLNPTNCVMHTCIHPRLN